MFAKLVRRPPATPRVAAAQAPGESAPSAAAARVEPPAPVRPDPPEAARVPAADPQDPARRRMRAFAFAAADLLVEAAADGTILDVIGAVHERLARPPAALVGQPLGTLITPSDQAPLGMAMALAPTRGRIQPMVLRLADGARSPIVLSATLLAGPPARLCVAIGPLPVPLAEAAGPDGAIAPDGFAREAEALLRAGGDARLGMIELVGWQAIKERLPAAEQAQLRAAIGGVMREAGATGTSELAEGRFGVLTSGDGGTGQLVRSLEQFLARSAARSLSRVASAELPLQAGDMPQATASRLLRYAVARFTTDGAAAAAATGAAGGLAGILAQAELRTQAVRAALLGHRFRLAFQPVVMLADRTVHHYEALIRPIATPGTPVHGTQEFITFAEAVGLSPVLDFAVLEQALMALRAAPQASVAVNLSGLSLQDGEFSQRMFALIADMSSVIGAEPPSEGARPRGRLLIELTETAEIEDMDSAAAAIARLRATGIAVCLDDFGAGAAAFRYLQQFKVDYVKIDGGFVHAAAVGGARERGMVSAMVDLAGTVGAGTVAEMVETDAQAALMRELGVQQGQGWLFGKPGGLPGARR